MDVEAEAEKPMMNAKLIEAMATACFTAPPFGDDMRILSRGVESWRKTVEQGGLPGKVGEVTPLQTIERAPESRQSLGRI